MKMNRFTLEQALYILAMALAAGMRLAPLGLTALNDAEAMLALQSFDLLHGSLVTLAPYPLYILGTTLLSFIFGASTFVARILPATFGILLVGLPYLLRKQIGQRAALILAFMIALDPGLIGSSIQASSSLLGLTCVLFALAGWVRRKPVLAGVFFGLALLGGPGIWPGLVGIVIAGAVSFRKIDFGEDIPPFDWRKAGISAAAGVILAGTLFFWVPTGISAAAASLSEYIIGWGRASRVPVPLLLGAMLVYEILGLFLGISGAVRGWFIERHGLDLFLMIWLVSALVFLTIYPARQVMDLVWVIFPMLGLASRQLDRMLVIERSDRLAIAGQAGLVLLLVLLLINLAISWPNAEPSAANQTYRWIVLVLALLLLVVESVLVAWGWSVKIAVSGMLWGITGLLAIYTLSSGFHSTGLAGRASAELWRSAPTFTGADLFLSTVHDYTLWTPELKETPQIVLTNIQSPALRWALRNYPGLSEESVLPATAQPEIMVTGDNGEIAQAAAYTGQGFQLSQAPAWDLITPAEWMNWLFYRKVKDDAWRTTNMILWVRSDRFPGSSNQSKNP